MRPPVRAMAVLGAVIGLAVIGCGSGAAEGSGPAAASASPSASATAAGSPLCQAFNTLAASPEAAVLAEDNAGQERSQQAMESFAPSLRAFLGQYSPQMPPEVAQDFEAIAAEIDKVAALNDSSSLSEVGGAMAGLVKLRDESDAVDAYTQSTCGTSLNF